MTVPSGELRTRYWEGTTVTGHNREEKQWEEDDDDEKIQWCRQSLKEVAGDYKTKSTRKRDLLTTRVEDVIMIMIYRLNDSYWQFVYDACGTYKISHHTLRCCVSCHVSLQSITLWSGVIMSLLSKQWKRGCREGASSLWGCANSANIQEEEGQIRPWLKSCQTKSRSVLDSDSLNR